MAGGAGSAIGRGGMLTKVLAAKRAARSGAATVIASGREPDVLTRLAGGEAIGTELHAEAQTLAARKQWLADHVQLAGRLTLDAGAVRALAREGKSLLPIGVVAVDGAFQRGEVVGCFDPEGREVARGWSTTTRRRRPGSCASRRPRSRRCWATSTSPSSSTATTSSSSDKWGQTRLFDKWGQTR